jgi:hypothetical protein
VWFCTAIFPVFIKIPFARDSQFSPGLTALIFSPYSIPCFRSFGLQKSIPDSLVEMDMVRTIIYLMDVSDLDTVRTIIYSMDLSRMEFKMEFRMEHPYVCELCPPNFMRLGVPIHLAMPILLRMSTLEEGIRHAEEPRRLMSFEEFHSRNPHDPRSSELLNQIERISRFQLRVVVLFKFQYFLGYIETCRWNTYSHGAWVLSAHEHRFASKTIRWHTSSHGARDVNAPARWLASTTVRLTRRRFGVRIKNNTKNYVGLKFEPWVWFRKRKIYFQVQETEEKAARIRDVAKYWLKSEGRDPLNFGEEDYSYLDNFQEFHPQQSVKEIKRLVLEYAQPFLEEVQLSQEVPIVDQRPYVELARIGDGEHINNTIQGFLPSDSEINNWIQELCRPVDADEQTTDMTGEPQSVSANPEFAGI